MSENKLPEFWKTYVGLVAAAAFVAYIFLVENKREPAGDDKPKEKLFAADKARVEELKIARAGGETLRLARDGAGWRLVEPLAAAADAPAVESLLQGIEGAEIQDEASKEGGALAGYGLEKPRLRVEVKREGAPAPVVLLIGDKLVDGSGVYAKTEDKPRVFTLASFVESSLDKKPFDLRDRDVLKVKRDAVTSLDVLGPEGSYSLARDARAEWAFTKPVATKAGRWAVDGLLGTLENLRMDAIAAEDAKDLKPFGLDKPARRVTLGLASGETRTLEIGKETADKKYPVRVEGAPFVAVVPATLAEDLAKGMANLRAKRLLEVATYDVAGFDAAESGATKTYE